MKTIAQSAAEQVMEVVPLVMRIIRTKLHEQRADMNIHQLRSMLYIDRNHETSLSKVAAHVGVSLPTMSVLIDKLVERKLVSRDARCGDGDRRKMCLSLTLQGQDQLSVTYAFAQKFLAEKMSVLSTEELKTISQAMQILQSLFILNLEKQPIAQAEK